MIRPFAPTPSDDVQNPFLDVVYRVHRREAWSALSTALLRRGASRVQLVARMPDGLDLVADSAGAPRPGAELPERAMLEQCFDENRCLRDERTGTAYLPCMERDEVAVVARVERAASATDAAWRTLPALALAFGAALTQRSFVLQARATRELSAAVTASESPQDGAMRALKALSPLVEAADGLVMAPRGGRLVVLADYGLHAPRRDLQLAGGLPYPRGSSWTAFRTGRTQFIRHYPDHATAVPDLAIAPVVLDVPLMRHGAPRRVLTLAFDSDGVPTEGDVAIVATAADAMSGLLDGLREAQFQDRLFDLLETAARASVVEVQHEVLRLAVACVPGAQTGHLAIREADAPDSFRVHYRSGEDRGPGEPIAEADWRAWCGMAPEAWGKGRPRILRRGEADLAGRARALGLARLHDDAGAPLDPEANLCLPLARDGYVWGVLDLENAVHQEAFGADSLRVINQVGLAASLLGRMIEDRDHAEALARTDPLTRIANRRGGEAALTRALGGARPAEGALAVLMLDLGGFKALNDRRGHAAGDAALRAVAEVLRREVREGDTVARWGGDEFLLVLPRQDAARARTVAERLVGAVGRLTVEGFSLSAHAGVATHPEDGRAADDLLRIADARMYQAKRGVHTGIVDEG